MKISISEKSFAFGYFFILLFLQYFFGAIVSSLALIPLALFSLFYLRLSKKEVLAIYPLLVFLFLSIISAFRNDDINFYYFFRDCFYLLMPILFIRFGTYFSKFKDSHVILEILILFFAIMSLILAFNGLLMYFSGSGFSEIRYNNPFYNFFPTYLLIFLIGVNPQNIKGKKSFLKSFYNVFFIIALVSVVFTFSRTQYVISSFVVIASVFYSRKFNLRVLLTIIYIFIVIAIFFNVFPSNILIQKFSSSFAEGFSFLQGGSINPVSQWRSFEILLLFDLFSSRSIIDFYIGLGCGSFITVPFTVSQNLQIGDTVPILHNAFGTAFMKGGLIGTLFYLLFLFQLSFRFVSKYQNLSHAGLSWNLSLIQLGLAITVVVTSFLTHGIYSNNFDFLLLFIMSYIASYQPSEKNIET